MTRMGNRFTREDAIALLERIARGEGNDAEDRVYALEIVGAAERLESPAEAAVGRS